MANTLRLGFRALPLLLILIFMAATLSCGGSGGEEGIDPSIANLPPTAVIIVTPVVIHPSDVVTLDGSESNDPEGDEIASYSWAQTAGAEVALSSTGEPVVTFTAPGVGIFTFTLVVTDSLGNASGIASVDIPVISDDDTTDGDDGDDDVVMTAVFVSTATGSDDPDQSGSYLYPVKTVGRGIEVAVAKGLSDVYVMEGTYIEEVNLTGGIDIVGCVASVDGQGNITYASNNSTTVIQAPTGVANALTAASISDAGLDCLTITGGDAATSRGLRINNSTDIEIDDVSFITPGQSGGTCRDVDINNGTSIAISDSDFTNGGNCDDYVAISAENSDGVTSSSNAFTFESVVETNLKAVTAVSSSNVAVTGSDISDGGTPLPSTAILTAIAFGDVTATTVEDNTLSVQGSRISTGVSVMCTTVASAVMVEHNDIVFSGASESARGVRINCPMLGGAFAIERNRMELSPITNQEMPVEGVQAALQMRPVTLDVINNIVVMPLVANDKANKAGVNLNLLDATSTVNVLHNNFIILGNQGDLTAVRSDMPNVQFSTMGNVIFIYGASTDNAVFTLPSGCDANWCAKDIVANLINTEFFAQPLHLAYYTDTLATVALDVANECDDLAPPPQCISGDVDRRDNNIPGGLDPFDFDLDAGELLPANQGYVVDLGPVGTGVDVDIENSARSDGTPDIGAVEY
jgi:hypothetical protein